jgi:prevent-host-death family protein
MPEKAAAWPVTQARARVSEVVDRALKQGPQAIIRNGGPAVVVVSVEEWTRKAGHKGTLAEFFAGSPLRGSGQQERISPAASGRNHSSFWRSSATASPSLRRFAPPSTNLRVSFALARSSGSRSDLGVDLRGEIGFGAREVKGYLKAQPDRGRATKIAGEAQRGFRCDRALPRTIWLIRDAGSRSASASAWADKPRASSSSFSTCPGCGTGPANGRIRAIATRVSLSVIIYDLHVPGVSIPELEGDPPGPAG